MRAKRLKLPSDVPQEGRLREHYRLQPDWRAVLSFLRKRPLTLEALLKAEEKLDELFPDATFHLELTQLSNQDPKRLLVVIRTRTGSTARLHDSEALLHLDEFDVWWLKAVAGTNVDVDFDLFLG